ncbi:hypothetical protein EVJ58_g4346 [Rhodofomes roseus]|uniref:Uncharacterized protein n=1 Tax=Rhodofomes roseus TaxID=34475 RepID=A0A4Y9YI74_9APHY|nr:hypothetical protein EVJ58_g4346 [Rhodofomes roseus]
MASALHINAIHDIIYAVELANTLGTSQAHVITLSMLRFRGEMRGMDKAEYEYLSDRANNYQ